MFAGKKIGDRTTTVIAGHAPPSSVSILVCHMGTWEFFSGGGQTQEFTPGRNKRHTGDAPSHQPIVAGVFLQRTVGTWK